MKLTRFLFSLGLIGFGLINFSFGYLSEYIDINTNDGFTLNGNTFIIDEKLNFIDTNYVGYSNTCGFGRRPNLFFWTDEGLAFYNATNPAGILIYTGYCKTQYNSENYDNLQGCSEILSVENLFNQNLTFKKVIFNGMTSYNGCMVWNYDGNPSNIAFIDNNDNAYIFPRAGGNYTNYSQYGYSLINPDSTREDVINEYAIELSPFNGGGDDDSSDYPPVEYISTYGQFFINKGDAYQLYETLGYSEGICYGDFSTGSIVDSGSYNYFLSYLLPTECDDSEDYCGGSFFDFYNTQSGLSLQSYFNRYYYTAKSIFEHPDNVSLLSALVGYPKGIWYIMYKIFYFYDNLSIPFSSVDYLAYCDMAVNGFEPSDTFDNPHSLAFENFIQEVMEVYLRGDVDFGSGDDVGTGMVAVSLSSSTGSLSEWFSRLKFAVLNNRFVFSSHDGILPVYIGFAFILTLLYYGFKR